MENVLSGLIGFIQTFLMTFWTILSKPRNFEEIFLLKSDGTSLNKSNVISVYPFFVLSTFLFSMFLIHIGRVDVDQLKDLNRMVGDDLLKNFSVSVIATSSLPIIVSTLFITILISKIFFFRKNMREQYDTSYTWIIYMFSFQVLLFSFSFIIAGTIDFFLNEFGLARGTLSELDAGTVIVSTLLTASCLIGLIWPFLIIFTNKEKLEHSFFKSWKKATAIAILMQLLVPVVFIVLIKTTERDDPIPFASEPFEIKYKRSGNQYLIGIDLKFIWKSQETAYLQKEDSLALQLSVGPRYQYSSPEYPISIDEWSERNSEVMILRVNEIYWLHLSGAIDSSNFFLFKNAQKHKEFILARGHNFSLPKGLNAIEKLYFNFQRIRFTKIL